MVSVSGGISIGEALSLGGGISLTGVWSEAVDLRGDRTGTCSLSTPLVLIVIL